jgi:cob(I)alamin adenosyltransferase
MQKGLLMVFTGNGKGKTTSALGLSLRSAGHGLKVCFIQFIKGGWKYGELNSVGKFKDMIDFYVMGRGFTWESDDIEKDKKMGCKAWDFAQRAIASGQYNLVVLDEFTYILNYGGLDKQKALQILKNRPPNLHIAITGRDASDKLIAAADLVTEMKESKHPFNAGIKAQKGIEF